METVASLFGGSPFGTPIDQRIGKITCWMLSLMN